jgi:hypothetical protein
MKRKEPTAKEREHPRPEDERSGRLLVDLMRDSPLRDVPIEPGAIRMPVRGVKL